MYKKNEGISENDRLQNRFSSYVSMSIHRERIIKRLNDQLEKKGKITVSGKISARYFYENVYL